MVKAPANASKRGVSVSGSAALSGAEERYATIAEAAYFRAEQRHFEPGHEVEDWLAAESLLLEAT
jgi:hypothetical protein